MFCPAQVYALLKTLLWVATADYNLFLAGHLLLRQPLLYIKRL